MGKHENPNPLDIQGRKTQFQIAKAALEAKIDTAFQNLPPGRDVVDEIKREHARLQREAEEIESISRCLAGISPLQRGVKVNHGGEERGYHGGDNGEGCDNDDDNEDNDDDCIALLNDQGRDGVSMGKEHEGKSVLKRVSGMIEALCVRRKKG